MSFAIKDPTGCTEDVVAQGVLCNSLRCGHCLCPVMEGQTFVALHEPYVCVVHAQCIPYFHYNKEGRMAATSAETRALGEKDYDDDERLVVRYLRNPVTAKKVPTLIQAALVRVCMRAALVNLWRREVFNVEGERRDAAERKIAAEKVDALLHNKKTILDEYDPTVEFLSNVKASVDAEVHPPPTAVEK